MLKFNTLRTKFIVLTLCSVLVSIFVIGGFGINSAVKVINDDTEKIMLLSCESKSHEANNLLSRISQSVDMLVSHFYNGIEDIERFMTDEDYLTEYTNKIESDVVNFARNTDGSIAVYVRYNTEFSSPTSGILYSRENESKSYQKNTPTDILAFDRSDTERVGWYYIPLESKKPLWISPYTNKNINDIYMISYVVPIFFEGEFIGVIGMDIDFYSILEKIEQGSDVYKSSTTYLADMGGGLAYYTVNSKAQSVNISELVGAVPELLSESSSGLNLYSININGVEMKAGFNQLMNGMKVMHTVAQDEIYEVRENLISSVLLWGIIIASVSIFITIILTTYIITPLQNLTDAARRVANGDLSVEIDINSGDEIGVLAESFGKTIESLKDYHAHLKGLAYRDALTGVKNKTAYLDAIRKLEDEIKYGMPKFGVVVMDLNDLKKVNDQMGHDYGDMLIVTACRIICNSFKHSPVYRIGGDEFVIILEGNELENYDASIVIFDKDIEEHNEKTNNDFRLSVARGVSIYNHVIDVSYNMVFKRADEAMYENKMTTKRIV